MNDYKRYFFRLAVCILSLCYFPMVILHAQISEGGLPPSFQFASNLRSQGQAVQVPVNFSVEDLKAVDAWHVSQGAPLAIAQIIDTDLSLDNSGDWITLPDGRQVWQLHLQAPDAIALLLYYSDFYIPEGGKLFIYNIDKSQVLGAYTNRTHPTNGHFATELIAGDEIILEYVPAPTGEQAAIRISGVGYGYNHLYVVADRGSRRGELSGSCMVNINCEEGEEWQLQKKGVCHTIQKIGNQSFICSGSLVNNTAKDMKPYILSAFHCSQSDKGTYESTDEELLQWMFVFHLEHMGCDNSSLTYIPKTMVGCTRKAATPIEGGSDGLLLLLNDNIPANYNVFYNGWDRRNVPATSGVGIHHPAGDYMKISTFGKYPAESASWNNSDNDQTGALSAHWNVTFDETPNGHGVTEGGSSGSPLFNQDGLIVGTLSGGNSTCNFSDGLNLYGKLANHWNKYSNKDSIGRMDVWLDPLNTGAITLGGMTQTGEVINTDLKYPTDITATKTETGHVLLKWEAPLFNQIAGWGDQAVYYEFGYDGQPFYYGQKWDTEDLAPIHKKTLTTVHFVPTSRVSYAVYIKQGNRIYEEDLSNLTAGKTNAIQLKIPFVIDAGQDLLVAIQVKSYNKLIHPAYADAGSAIDGKGNIYSEDGETWNTMPTDVMDANFILSFTVTSKEGILPDNASLLKATTQPITPLAGNNVKITKAESASSSQEGTLITAFPEITGYQVYRDQAKIASLPSSSTKYTDKSPASTSTIYGVTTLYGNEESTPATIQLETASANEDLTVENTDIQPRLFSEQVNIINYQQVKSLEIYTADGRLVGKIKNPGNMVNTGSLPQGVYIFRITSDGGTKVVQGIKK